MCLGKLLCSHLPPVETVNVLEVVRQVQLLLTGTGWLSLVNSRLANQANKQAAEIRANLSHLAGNLKPNLINGIINLVQVLLQKPCVTTQANKHTQTQGHTDTQTHRHTHRGACRAEWQ